MGLAIASPPPAAVRYGTAASSCVDMKDRSWCYERVAHKRTSYCDSDPAGAAQRCCATCAEWNRTRHVSRPEGPERMKLECGDAQRRQMLGRPLTASERVVVANCPSEWSPWWFISKLQESLTGFENSTHRTEGEPWARGLKSSAKDKRHNMTGWGPWTLKSISWIKAPTSPYRTLLV